MAGEIARRFALLSEPMRIRIIDTLRERGEASVQEIADALGATHANVSKHLNILLAAGIVDRRKSGTKAIYRVADEGVFRLCEDVCGGIAERARTLGALFEPAA